MKDAQLKKVLRVIESGRFVSQRRSAHLCGMSPRTVLRVLNEARANGLVLEKVQTLRVKEYGPYGRGRK